jgi:hypothetical protein
LHFVIPAQAGIQRRWLTKTLGPRFRGDDDELNRGVTVFPDAQQASEGIH